MVENGIKSNIRWKTGCAAFIWWKMGLKAIILLVWELLIIISLYNQLLQKVPEAAYSTDDLWADFQSAVEVPTTGATDVTKPIDNKPKPASGINVLFSFLAISIRLLVTEPIHGILVVVLCKGDELQYGVDESYKLYVNSKGNPNYAHIEAATVYGALHVLCVLDKSFMRRWHLKDRTPCDNKARYGRTQLLCRRALFANLFQCMLDPYGIAKWSVTHVDWSEGKWHPKSYHEQDFSYQLIKNITKKTMVMPCMWNGINRPCYLFARKFKPDTLHRMIDLFTNQMML
ncbi:putative beta-N-acetylhexosaminidase [Helianthus debilis subsp. tardiflorus]